jgi:hypothetical protein
MRLALARLCLDCEEVYDGERCPVYGSETFAFLKRWVPQTCRRQSAGSATSRR